MQRNGNYRVNPELRHLQQCKGAHGTNALKRLFDSTTSDHSQAKEVDFKPRSLHGGMREVGCRDLNLRDTRA